MNDIIDSLQQKWEDDKKSNIPNSDEMNEVVKKIASKKRENLFFHYGNILILSLVLIGISLFFWFVAPVEETLSRIGAGLMIVGLIVRIVIEAFSIGKSKKIDVEVSSLEHTERAIEFHRFRKFVHSWVTIIIVGLYTLGFYLISPEFSKYISFWFMILIDVSYVFIAIILIIIIRKAIIKEMKTLDEIIELKKEIQN